MPKSKRYKRKTAAAKAHKRNGSFGGQQQAQKQPSLQTQKATSKKNNNKKKMKRSEEETEVQAFDDLEWETVATAMEDRMAWGKCFVCKLHICLFVFRPDCGMERTLC